MRRKNIIFALSILIILTSLISSCTVSSPSDTSNQSSSQTSDTSKKIAELEEQIVLLIQSQQLSDTERKKQIELLEAELNLLKEESEESSKEPQEDKNDESQIFKYTLENGKAIITEINAKEESITIPSVIDGYQVISIGSQALSSNSVRNVIISSGIEKLDWFAFSGCVSLSSVSIPDSVSSIGYGAFDNTSKSLTIYCTRDSFAHKYAQSYGITYGIT